MSSIIIKKIPDHLYKKFKLLCRAEGMTVKGFVIKKMEEFCKGGDMSNPLSYNNCPVCDAANPIHKIGASDPLGIYFYCQNPKCPRFDIPYNMVLFENDDEE